MTNFVELLELFFFVQCLLLYSMFCQRAGDCIDVFLCVLQHVDAFKLIMSGASGGSNEKRLASQFIARFHKYFPALFDKCLDVMMDLCEDVDVAVSSQHCCCC